MREHSKPVATATDEPFGPQELREHLDEALCVILQGPPGTGKTWLAEQLVESLTETSDIASCQLTTLLESRPLEEHLANPSTLAAPPIVWELVQLHPGYSYEDLVRGQVAASSDTTDGPGLRFVSKDRIVVEMAQVANARKGQPTLLVLDEINRCNLAAVLGELIMVLEKSKRGKAIRLQYPAPPEATSGDLLTLPDNLWILGTMNTADRSIALVDYAIRRRFRFVDVKPSRTALAAYYEEAPPPQLTRVLELFDSVRALVDDPNLQVGHSYFMERLEPGTDPRPWARRLAGRFLYEVLPLLREYSQESKLTKSEISAAGTRFALDRPETAMERKQDELAIWLGGA